jgi:hypothetical protein
MAEDVKDWKNKLTNEEKQFLTNIFRFFTQGDIDVAGGYVDNYLPYFPQPEVRMMLLGFAAREALHIAAYSHLIETLGLPDTTAITPEGVVSGYVNMVNYQQIILRCPSLVFESCSLDNIQDKKIFFSISDFLYWVNKQDVEPFKMVNYKNDDCGTVYSYNVANRKFNTLNFKLVNEFNEFIYDAPDFLLQLQITVFDKDNAYFKEASLQVLKLLNDIYFILLNIVSFFGVFQRKLKK